MRGLRLGGRGEGRAAARGRLTPPPPPAVASGWQVSSFSEAKAQQTLQQKPAQYLRFNQRQLTRVYPSPYRVDSSNCNPQPFWNAGCQMGGRPEPRPPHPRPRSVSPGRPARRPWVGPFVPGCVGVSRAGPRDGWPGGVAVLVPAGEPWAWRGAGGRRGRVPTGPPPTLACSRPELPVGGPDAATEPGQVQRQRQLRLRAEATEHVPG